MWSLSLLIRLALPEDIQRTTEILASYNMDPPTSYIVVVAENDGEIVGCAGLHEMRWNASGWLAHVAVAREHKRRGIGSLLVNEAVWRARQWGLSAVWLETYFWNTKFYESLGFGGVLVKTAPREVLDWRGDNRCRLMCALF